MISSLTVFTSSQDGLALAPAGAVVVDEHDEVSGANEGFFVRDAFVVSVLVFDDDERRSVVLALDELHPALIVDLERNGVHSSSPPSRSSDGMMVRSVMFP